MGVAIPQIITEDRASGALIVDGSLRFDTNKPTYLSRTPGSDGNRKTWSWSAWIKRGKLDSTRRVWGLYTNSSPAYGYEYLSFDSNHKIDWYQATGGSSWTGRLYTTEVFRDTSSWYHIVVVLDITNSTSSDRMRIYKNGQRITSFDSASYPTTETPATNSAQVHYMGVHYASQSESNDALVSQVYFIDGQALDASYFGYTDALTNTWRPKKLSSSVAFGTNGFYLPFDGSAPIGQDQSGRGNNWTPVNFGGSNTLEKATGALPILNTDGGGKVARVGVRTDSSASSLVLALPLVGIKSDFSNKINSGTTEKSITTDNVTFVSTQSNFYGGSSFFTSGSSNGRILIPTGTFNFGTGDYTIEFWAYLTGTGDQGANNRRLITAQSESGTYFAIYTASSISALIAYPGASPHTSIPNAVWQNKWTHFAYTRSGGTSYQFINGVLNGTINASAQNFPDVGYQIGRYDSSNGGIDGYIQDFRIYKGLAKYTQNFIPASTDPDILPDTPSGVSYTSNLTQITDGAVALGAASSYLTLASSADFAFGTGDFTIEFFFNSRNVSSSQLGFFQTSDTTGGLKTSYASGIMISQGMNTSGTSLSGGIVANILNTYVGSDVVEITTNVWYHCALTRSSGTVRLFINGKLSASSTISGSIDATNLVVGGFYSTSYLFDGTLSNFHVVKGTALYTSNFTPPSAPISSVANTKLLCCKSNSSATAFDVSPGTITANGNVAATNFNPFTANINTQRGKSSGWCTLNPLDIGGGTLSNGNLEHTYSSSNIRVKSTISIPTTGKWYAEFVASNAGGGNSLMGVATSASALTGTNWYLGNDAGSWGLQVGSGTMYTYHNGGYSSFGTAINGDVIAVAVDRAAGKIWWAVNNIWIAGGDPVSGTNARYTNIPSTDGLFFAISNASNSSIACNFGQKPFKFPPPAGFQPLALANTPRPTIVRPDQYVGVTTYIGNASTRSIDIGFKPDFVWIKRRDSGGYNHQLYDSVRGPGLTLRTSQAEAELSVPSNLTSFNSNGFSLGPNTDEVNVNNGSFVAWSWKAGGNSNTYNINDVGYATASAAGLTAGTITLTGASVNTKSGFSIITYTGNGTSGATVSHGLGNTPGLLIVKRRSNTGSTANWAVLHSSLTAGYNLFLNTTDNAQAYSPSRFTSTVPTSTVFSLGSGDETNYSGGTFVAYSWAEIPGFSKFGSYTGNGSTDGPMVITGFRPKFLLVKNTTSAYDWRIHDTSRDPYNVAQTELFPNGSYAEAQNSAYYYDILSNGFKLRTSDIRNNGSGDTYIYAAFAETPTQNLYGAQANAR